MSGQRRRALLSASDKTGIVELGRALAERGWELLSTGGTARALRQEGGLEVTDVSQATGHPEMMDGRVKTLHPAVHGGLLARRDRPDDLEALERHGYGPIDLVAVNLYPFERTVEGGGVSLDEAMEYVDIGGPTLIRAAAKNHRWVWPVVDPADYSAVLEAIDQEGDRSDPVRSDLRARLAAKVFQHVSGYDAAVATYLEGIAEEASGEAASGPGAEVTDGAHQAEAPPRAVRRLERNRALRYGENPDQRAALYVRDGARGSGVAGLEQLQGKELSYNNLLDLDGALLSLAPFAPSSRAAVCIVKHTTPCGLAVGDTVAEAYERALRTDPTSAFGSVIAVNRPVDEAAARSMGELFIECLVAPAFSPEAREILGSKKNLRLLTMPEGDPEALPLPVADALEALAPESQVAARFLGAYGRTPDPWVARDIYGGVLVQEAPSPPWYGAPGDQWTVATKRSPDSGEADDLAFAWGAVFGVKSNAILLARHGATLGIGAGQMSRVDSSRIAVEKAGDAGLELDGAVLASDAFFPFRDGVDAAAEAGVRAIIQPGGSRRDDEVIAAADEHGMAMVLTGRRLFRH